MPLPIYQPVKKKPKIASPSLDDLDDYCLSKVIAHALIQSQWRSNEPYQGDNGATERKLSLVSKRWYFLTQTQVGDYGIRKINLEEVLKQDSRYKTTRQATSTTSVKTPKRMPIIGIGSATIGSKTPAGSYKLRPNYGVLSQRNMTSAMSNQPHQTNKAGNLHCGYDIKLFRSIQSKLLKYKHVQFFGNISTDNFNKLLVILNSTRVERLDLLGVKIEGAKVYLNSPKLTALDSLKPLVHLEKLTYTITTNPKDDSTNALLWTIFQRAIYLKELKVFLVDKNDSTGAALATSLEASNPQTATQSFIERLTSACLHKSHPHLTKIVFDKIQQVSAIERPVTTGQSSQACSYSSLIKKVLSEEKGVLHFDTNDSSFINYLIQASNRLCTRPELRHLILSCPIVSLDLLQQLVKLKNLGSEYLSIVVENFDQVGDLKTILGEFKPNRSDRARCVVNLYLQDQKFVDCEEKVKNLIQLTRSADINVYISALQRISIDCCHLMWSTGRALQTAAAFDSPGKCIFKITLQMYPIKPNTVNPFEITIPFGRCSQYKISSTSEDVVRHREIMRALKKDCYHQFVKSVRENSVQ